MTNKEYDVIVLGGSRAGVESAVSASKSGLKTAIIEENRIGGLKTLASEEPLETLLENNKIIQECLNAKNNGLVFSGVSFDPDIFYDGIKENAESLSKELVDDLKDNNVDIYLGHGIARPDHTMAVIREGTNTRVLKWKKLIYAGDPVISVPSIIRNNAKTYYTTSNFGLLDHFPNGLIIYGEGEKALHLASIWATLGSKVYLICPNKKILSSVPDEIENLIVKELEEKKVKVYLDYEIKELYQDSSNDFHIEIENNETDKVASIIGSELMVLLKEGTSLSGIEAMNLQQDNGWIKVDNSFRTSNPDVYTWTGSQLSSENKILSQKAADYITKIITNEEDESFIVPITPYVLKTNPAYAKIGDIDNKDNKLIGKIEDKKNQFLEVIIDPEFGEIIGAQSYHKDAEDIIYLIEFLMNTEVSAEDLLEAAFPHNSSYSIIQTAIAKALENK